MSTIIGGWDRQDVAIAQRKLVLTELSADPASIGPYTAFRWAMDTIGLEDATLLDAGCGVGHYAILCERFYPHICYHGTDISEAMIDQARQLAPLATFSVCDFKDNAFGDYDIVLAGQVIEQLDDPPAMLDLLLTHARRYIILNRIRLTPDESHRITEGTYCGAVGRTWLWNREDITRRIEQHAEIIAANDWWATDQVAFVVNTHIGDDARILQEAKKDATDFVPLDELLRMENDQPAELCGCANVCAGACSCART